MFKKRIALAAIATATSMALSSLAYSADYYGGESTRDAYIGINLAAMQYAEDGFEDATVSAIYGRLGKQYTETFAGEIRLGTGLGSDSVYAPILHRDIDLEVQEFYGAYLKAGIPVAEKWYPYVLVGYTQISVESSVTYMGPVSSFGYISVEDKVDDFSYGVGADIEMTRDVKGSVEFISYADKDGAQFTSLSFGVSKAF